MEIFALVSLVCSLIESPDKIVSSTERDSATIHLPEIKRKIIIEDFNYEHQLEERYFFYAIEIEND